MDNTFNNISHRLIDILQLKQVAEDEFCGSRNGHPFILLLVNTYSPSIIFKVPLKQFPTYENIEVPETVCGLINGQEIELSIENGCGWLTVNDYMNYDGGFISELFDQLLDFVESHELKIEEDCSVCGAKENVQIQYHKGNIRRICEICSMDISQMVEDEQKKKQRKKYKYWFLLPAAVLSYAIGWVIVWVAYERLFDLYGTDSIEVPYEALGIASLIAAIIISIPAVFITKRLFLTSMKTLAVCATALVVTGTIIGEVLIVFIWLYKSFKVLDIRAASHLLPLVIKNYDTVTVVIKLFIVLISIGLVCVLSKSKEGSEKIHIL